MHDTSLQLVAWRYDRGGVLSLGDRTCKYEYAPYYHPNMIGN